MPKVYRYYLLLSHEGGVLSLRSFQSLVFGVLGFHSFQSLVLASPLNFAPLVSLLMVCSSSSKPFATGESLLGSQGAEHTRVVLAQQVDVFLPLWRLAPLHGWRVRQGPSSSAVCTF